ncbi:unnamed protein product [Trichogramma brassicae]|uniref:Uncharacterized protein n=1 Tax=Trichogramma brassicae TaxID=86971 RepID=A0A6H5IQS3_9HYME|nr:unnamed protein product [Trichogramma brassicae]
MLTPPPPPTPPSITPEESPKKLPLMKNNVDVVQSMNDLTIATPQENSTKKLDPAFLAELEKHLGEKEANKNSNVNHRTPQHVATVAMAADNTVIPMLKPPPPSIKPKSPNTDLQQQQQPQQQQNFNFPPIKVQNTWQPLQPSIVQPKNSNVQLRPRSQGSNERHSEPNSLDTVSLQQFPSLPTATTMRSTTPSNSSVVPRPASIAGSVLNEQVYAELRRTVPNLEQLSQNEFNTLYNKAIRENILSTYRANSTALASAACNSMHMKSSSTMNPSQSTMNAVAAASILQQQQRQTLPREFSPSRKQPPSYNPPPPFSPMKPIQNGTAHQKINVDQNTNTASLMNFTPTRPVNQSSPVTTNSNLARNLLPQMNDSKPQQHQLVPAPSTYPGGASPPLTGASQQLVMSLNDEFRASKVMKVQQEAQDASQQEALAALQATGWDTAEAARQIGRDRLAKIETLVSFHGEGNDLDVVTLRSMREKVNWKTEENLQEFLDQLDSMISDWEGPLPNLRDIFAREEIDRLLTVSATSEYTDLQAYGAGKRFVEFVARSGYKDQPKVDEDGKPLLHRTTALHDATRRGCYDLVRELFDIYNRFDVNYTDHDGLTHFHAACASGHVAVIEKFLEFGQDPDCLNVSLIVNPPLHLALLLNHRKATHSLLKNGADPNLVFKGYTSLHVACNIRRDDLAELLLNIAKEVDQVIQIDALDKKGRTPLHWALLNGKKQTTEALLRNGANTNLADAEGLTPLHYICRKGKGHKLLEMFFKINEELDKPVQIEVEDKKGRTPLHYALRNRGCKKQIFQVLLRYAAKNGRLNLACNQSGSTPLQIILLETHYEDVDLAKIFFEINDEFNQLWQVNVVDKMGWTAQVWGLSSNVQMAEVLLRNGVDPNLADAAGRTPLHHICIFENQDMAEQFFMICDEIQLTVEIDARDNEGNTPLHCLMRNGYFRTMETLELMLRRGADPNLADAAGRTPLHQICRFQSQVMAEHFFEIIDKIQLTVEIDARDNERNTPLHLLMQSDYVLTQGRAELLLRRGADPNSANAEGMIPLHFICQREYDDGFVKKFFKICDEIQQTVQIDARDNLGRTPLQLAVVHILLNGVKFLLDRGADLSSFAYPAASCFLRAYNRDPFLDYFYKLRLMSGTLAIVELLEDKGYELDRDASLTIIKVFTNYKNHIRLQISDEFWRDGEFYHDGFGTEATRIMVNPSLSLDEVVKLPFEEAENLLTFEDYYKLGHSQEFYNFRRPFRDACVEHLCEKLCRGVFRRWALDSFLELTHYWLPILCCEMIIDESLRKEDLWRIYLANRNLSDAEKSDPLMSVLLL